MPDDVWSEVVTAVIVLEPGRVIETSGIEDMCRAAMASDKVPKA